VTTSLSLSDQLSGITSNCLDARNAGARAHGVRCGEPIQRCPRNQRDRAVVDGRPCREFPRALLPHQKWTAQHQSQSG
jgi:hypothetical protein